MKRSIARKWAKALDSGEYKQGTGQLRSKGNKFCCLGVLCNIHAQEHPEIAKTSENKSDYLGETGFTPQEVMEWAGMSHPSGKLLKSDTVYDSLIELNDTAKFTFPQIAKVIRKHWKEL